MTRISIHRTTDRMRMRDDKRNSTGRGDVDQPLLCSDGNDKSRNHLRSLGAGYTDKVARALLRTERADFQVNGPAIMESISSRLASGWKSLDMLG